MGLGKKEQIKKKRNTVTVAWTFAPPSEIIVPLKLVSVERVIVNYGEEV